MSTDVSPNAGIDKAIKALMKDLETHPVDMRVKIITTAINWEKVKARINEQDGDFDPQAL
ncbi:MAG TPA: hypothetical protein VF764_12200 [Steroidobacteraceae bacterium]